MYDYPQYKQNTFLYMEKDAIETATRLFLPNRKVLHNIVTDFVPCNEYEDDTELCELIRKEITHLIDELTHELAPEISQRMDRTWRITLDQAIQTKIGARWVERGDHLAIDPSGADSDNNVARELITAQLHEKIRQKAGEFCPIAIRCTTLWAGMGSLVARRFFEAIAIETENLPHNLGVTYDALLVRPHFLTRHGIAAGTGLLCIPLDPS